MEVLIRAAKRWNAGDRGGYPELYSPDVLLHGYAGLEPGLAGIQRVSEGF